MKEPSNAFDSEVDSKPRKEGKRLCKYAKLNVYALASVMEGVLSLSTPDSFNDPLDSRIPMEAWDLITKFLITNTKYAHKYLKLRDGEDEGYPIEGYAPDGERFYGDGFWDLFKGFLTDLMRHYAVSCFSDNRLSSSFGPIMRAIILGLFWNMTWMSFKAKSTNTWNR